MRSTWGVPCFRVIFSMDHSGKGISIFDKNSRKGDNIGKNSIVYVDLAWTKNPKC